MANVVGTLRVPFLTTAHGVCLLLSAICKLRKLCGLRGLRIDPLNRFTSTAQSPQAATVDPFVTPTRSRAAVALCMEAGR